MEIIRPIVQEEFIPVTYTSSPEIIKNCLKEVLEGSTLEPQAGVLDNTDMRKNSVNKLSKNTWRTLQLNIMNLTEDGILFCPMKTIQENKDRLLKENGKTLKKQFLISMNHKKQIKNAGK